MPPRVSRLLAGALLLGLLGPGVAVGQMQNVETIEGPQGERTTLTARPHGLAENLSARALGISEPDTTRWALSLIGAAPEDSISLTYAGETLPIERIDRPTDGPGPTKVYVSRESFLTMAETKTVTLHVGDISVSLPEALRREMKRIFEIVS